jgi:hypothetical protein
MNNRVLILLSRILDGAGDAVRTPSGVSPDRYAAKQRREQELFRDEIGGRGI